MFRIFRRSLNFFSKFSFSVKNEKKYGKELASLYAETLEKKTHPPFPQHQGYGGVTFYYEDGKFYFCRVWDECITETLLTFENKEKFVEWLGSKSDLNMSGDDPNDKDLFEKQKGYGGNQRIYMSDIRDFIYNANKEIK